ncbi:MAG: TrmH family RNA methyltransferase [Peptococcia bacterium]|jgi:TrmH family RNA methyltransferase
MEIIESRQNNLIKERIKLQQKKYRQSTGLFLVEGVRMVEEAWAAGQLTEVFVDDTVSSSPRGARLFQQLLEPNQEKERNKASTVNCHLVKPDILRLLAETESPQGIVGVASQTSVELSTLQIRHGLILILDGIQDPGNLGTIWRTAWAAGVDAIFCLPGTVDPYNGKTVRATMGGVFHVPVFAGTVSEWPALRQWCAKEGFQLVAGELGASRTHYDVSYGDRVALVIGNEAQGLLTVAPTELAERVKIPLMDGAESLNAAVACGILVYEVLRQRR